MTIRPILYFLKVEKAEDKELTLVHKIYDRVSFFALYMISSIWAKISGIWIFQIIPKTIGNCWA